MAQIYFRAIKTNLSAYDGRELENAFRKGLASVSQEIRNNFRETVKTWSPGGTHGKPIPGGIPKFKIHGPAMSPGGLAISVLTIHSVYYYLNFGTKRHAIKAKSGGVLRFRTMGKGSYRPKTHQGRLTSTSGGPVGPWVHAKSVDHPGNWGRGWDITITELTKSRSALSKALNSEIRNALGASGQVARVSR